MKTLISMTDFVIQQRSELMFKELGKACCKYADFLKRPLKLEMFVPCDYEGNFWKYPPTKEEWEWAQKDSADAEQSYKQKVFHYQQAKNKVLFEGFEIEGYYLMYHGFMYSMICELDNKTIESIIDIIPNNPLQLTTTAIKQIL